MRDGGLLHLVTAQIGGRDEVAEIVRLAALANGGRADRIGRWATRIDGSDGQRGG